MSVKYTRSVLEKAAASATSLVDLVRGLDAPLGSRTCRYVRDRLRHYAIETSHFVDEPLPERARTAYPAALLAEAAANSSSIRGMFEYMGLPPSDSPYGYVRAKLDRLGIDTSHFTDENVPLETRTRRCGATARVRGVRNRRVMARQTPRAGDRPHQREPRRRPPGQSALSLPFMPQSNGGILEGVHHHTVEWGREPVPQLARGR